MEKIENYRLINRSISIIQRLSNPYFDKQLSNYHIGCGQQFFLMHISKNPGISFQDLAKYGNYDKATATRAVQKLESEGYVSAKMDESDKRLRHLYTTEKAKPVLEAAWKVVTDWMKIITVGFTEEEVEQADELLKRMSDNAHSYMESLKGEES